MMTKKHYKKLAEIIKKHTKYDDRLWAKHGIDQYETNTILFLNELCIFLKDDNQNFDIDKFVKACGILLEEE